MAIGMDLFPAVTHCVLSADRVMAQSLTCGLTVDAERGRQVVKGKGTGEMRQRVIEWVILVKHITWYSLIVAFRSDTFSY